MRRAARVDRNHSEIMALARKCGLKVWDTSRLGDGFPDLLCAYGGLLELWEVKDGSKPPSRRRLTDDEQAFRDKGFPVRLVESAEDVLHAARVMRKDLEAINRERT